MRQATLIAIAAIRSRRRGLLERAATGHQPRHRHVVRRPSRRRSVAQGYPDITDGAQIAIVDSSGKVIGTGTFAYDKTQTGVQASVEASMLGKKGVDAAPLLPDIAVYRFTVSGLPGGLPRYGLKIGTRAVHWESAKTIKDPGLTLGSP